MQCYVGHANNIMSHHTSIIWVSTIHPWEYYLAKSLYQFPITLTLESVDDREYLMQRTVNKIKHSYLEPLTRFWSIFSEFKSKQRNLPRKDLRKTQQENPKRKATHIYIVFIAYEKKRYGKSKGFIGHMRAQQSFSKTATAFIPISIENLRLLQLIIWYMTLPLN